MCVRAHALCVCVCVRARALCVRACVRVCVRVCVVGTRGSGVWVGVRVGSTILQPDLR